MTTTGWRPGAISSDGSSVRPELRADAEDLEVVAGDELAPDLTRAAAAAQVDGGDDGAEQTGERAVVIAKVLVVRVGEADRAAGARFAKDDGEAAPTRRRRRAG